jgi:gingipain R
MRSQLPLFLSIPLLAWILGPVASAAVGAQVTVLDPRPGATLVRVSLEGYDSRHVDIGGASWLELSLPGEGYTEQVGAPRLPRVSRSLVVPDDQDVAVRVVSSRFHEVAGVLVAPARGPIPRTQDPASVPYSFGAAYGLDAWYPADIARVRDPYVLRDVRGAVLDANMLQYNPSTHVLRVYDELVLSVDSRGAPAARPLDRANAPDRRDASFEQLYRRHFLNYSSPGLVPFDQSGGMLVIANADFLAEMQPFVDWKNARGIPTTLVDVSTIGNNVAAIKSFVQQTYNASNLSYVLLVGDSVEVASGSFLGGASDPFYSEITADDYPDLLVGRFSAQTTAQVRTQVERSIRYEQQDHALSAGGWSTWGMGIASDQGPGHFGEYDFQHMNNIRADYLAYGFATVDQIYDPTATKAMITSGLNTGRRLVNYCGHGSDTSWGTTGFNNNDVALLANEGHLPFILSVACVNGNFSAGTCFAEAWMRATHNGQPSGAVGTYMSSIDQYWDEPMYAQDEATDLFCAQSWWGVGAIWFAGSCHLMDLLPSSGHDMFMTWIVFGDPSLRVLGTQPPPPSAYCTAKPSSNGLRPSIGGFGTPSASAGDFRLTCDQGMPNLVGLHFRGNGAQSIPWLGGTLCVQPPLARGMAFVFDGYGTAIEPVAFGPGDVGHTYYYQYYGRDPQNPDGTSVMISNALSVDVLP